MSYRLKTEEPDFSAFVTQSNPQVGGMVIKSRKGTKVPKLTQGEKQVTLRYGKPNPEHHGVFEAIEYGRVAPIIISSALGSNYKYAGVDVKTTKVVAFGARAGRVFETFNADSYLSVDANASYLASTGADGKTVSFSGTITPSSVLPAIVSSVQLSVGGNVLETTVDGTLNTISGDSLSSGSFNETTGAYNITFVGSAGTVATYTSTVAIATTVDLSSGGTNKLINLEIDGALYQNINLGQATGTSKTTIVNVINTAVGRTVASISGDYIKIDGLIASANVGSVKISAPSSGVSALNLVFDATAVTITGTSATSPTGFIPKAGEEVKFNFNYLVNIKSDTSFSLFTASPFDDDLEVYSVRVSRISGKQYRVVLSSVNTFGSSDVITYEFSLIREKNAFGRSLYYEDVFLDSDYLKIFVNPDYAGIADPLVETVILTGGDRGDEPTSSDFLECYNYFQQANVYKVKTFMDPYGTNLNNLINIINDYQPYAFGITVVPQGNNALAARTYRNNSGVDFDGVALYTNWLKINDSYNNSFAWTSGVGKIGVKYSQMSDVYDGLAPAGTDEQGRGGQLRGGFEIKEVEYDYTDADLELLNDANINPIIKKPSYGVMTYGDRTLQVVNSDTSFIPHRRLFNKMIEDITTQILEKQIFKLNDPIHRLLAKTQAETYIAPILALNLLREVYVQCDEDNNNDAILQVRKFILDVYVKVTPFSEFVTLRLTRLPQGGVVADFIQQ